MRIPEPTFYTKTRKFLKLKYQKYFEDVYISKKITLLNQAPLTLYPLAKVYSLQTHSQPSHKKEILTELADYSGKTQSELHKIFLSIDAKTEDYFKKNNLEKNPDYFYQNFEDYYILIARDDLTFRHAHHRLNIALSLAKARNLKSVIDYGGGIGRDCIVFAKEGFKTTHVDLLGPLCNFAQWRYKRRGLEVSVQSPQQFMTNTSHYDMILSFDVLEHMAEPIAILELWTQKLTKRGMIACYPDFDNEGTALHLEDNRKRRKEFYDFFYNKNFHLLYDKNFCTIFSKGKLSNV